MENKEQFAKKDLDKPNKKREIIGNIVLIVGVCVLLIGIFAIKNSLLIFAGISLILFGSAIASIGKLGFQKTVEISSAYEIAKAKAVAKSVKEGLKEDDK